MQLDMTEFETAFKNSIPCDGCEEPAHWRSFGHKVNDCGGGKGNPPPPYHKCTDCYMTWREVVRKRIEGSGDIGCRTCDRRFGTIEEFSNYRRF